MMAYCDSLGCLVVSQPSPQSTFIPGKEASQDLGVCRGYLEAYESEMCFLLAPSSGLTFPRALSLIHI